MRLRERIGKSQGEILLLSKWIASVVYSRLKEEWSIEEFSTIRDFVDRADRSVSYTRNCSQ